MRLFLTLIATIGLLFASIDINNASKKELTSLKGVGEKKAEAIIEYRKSHCFKSVDELINVKGIGKKIIENNRDNLTAGECNKK